jgi:hypothetical protein
MTYPIKGHSQEGALFSRAFGQFGIADVVGFYSCRPNEPHGSTKSLFRNADSWSILDDRLSEPEDRGLQCTAYFEEGAEGQALLDLNNRNGGIPSPGEVLETILHAIIGK